MFLSRLRRKTQIRRRKGGRETLAEDAVRFQDIVVSKTQERGVAVPIKLLRELQRGSEQGDGGKRLYKLDIRRAHLTDAHVEALTEALQELPVVRKLDLRGNDALTNQALNALNSLLKGQVELFRLVQADPSLADSSLSFLYSVKLDAAALSLDLAAMEELQAQTAALEVADSVLDVRHAFFEADVRESGTLTEHELSDAMRSVMGATPKAAETSRVLRFFGEPGAPGRDPTMINLGGFEAAMAGRLRESHTLPVLPQTRDDLLFGSAEDTGDQGNSECFSPWSTRSFGATTGSVRGSKGGGGVGGGDKRSPLSASQDLHSAAVMRTHVLPLPPWRGREGGSALDGTLKDNGQGRNPRGDDDLDNIFDDHNHNDREKGQGNTGHSTTPGRGGVIDQPIVCTSIEKDSSGYSTRRRSRSSSGNKEADGDTEAPAAPDKAPRKSGANSAARFERISTRGCSLRDVGREDFVLTDGSSDDELSCSSPAHGKGGGLMARKGSRLRNENLTWPSEPASKHNSPTSTSAAVADRRRHSSGPTPAVRGVEENGSGRSEKRVFFADGYPGGGRRASSTPQSSRSENQSAEGEAGSGASTYRRHSDRERRQNDGHATERSSKEKIGSTGEHGLSIDVLPSPSPCSSALISHQGTAASMTDQKNTILAPAEKAMGTVVSSGVDGDVDIGFHGVSAKETEPHSGPREEDYKTARGAIARTATSVAAPEMTIDGTPAINVSVSATPAAAGLGQVTQLEAFVVSKERRLGDEIDVDFSVGERRQPVGDGGKLQLASKASLLDPDGHRPSTATIAPAETSKRCGEEMKWSSAGAPAATATTTDVGSPSAVGGGSSVGGGVLAGGATLDLSASNLLGDTPQSRETTTLIQAVPAGSARDITNSGEDAAIENNPNVLMDQSGVEIRPPLEAITELQSGESSGESVINSDPRGSAAPAAPPATTVFTLDSEYCGGAMRKPYCLSPTNVMRHARGSGDTAAAAGSSCRERERLAARIQLSAGTYAAPAVTEGTSVDTGQQGVVSGPVLFASSTTGSCFDGGVIPDRCSREEAGWTSVKDSPASYGNADTACFLSARKTPSSPEREERGDRWVEESSAAVENDRCSSSSPSSRFYLPSSETKTAPLCGAGGSTSLYEGSAVVANKSTASLRGTEGARGFSRFAPEAVVQGGVGGHTERTDTIAGGEVKESGGLPRLDEDQLALRLTEGALVISRSGLAKMGAVLELKAVYGSGRDSIVGLHTLILSYNQLQVLDMSVLTTMPALRHLDISHNLLCRMEPMDGRDLPPRLETLNMSHNRISRIGGIGQCFLLRVMDLRHNRIKRVQGLEHLSLLEQLDLGHNLIAKTASARALSFNRSLKLLWLEGNPLARNPRYRPTLTCLLPHVRAIDSRSMPPSSDSEQRRWAAGGGSMEEEDESDRFNVTAASGVNTRGGRPRGIGGNVNVSREWQAVQDERRSKEWSQVMEWRKDQARREEEAEGLTPGGKHRSRQAVDAAQQKRQAEELARPRPRTCPSEEAINKAKVIACHRPAVAFGISYRGETGLSSTEAGCMPPSGRTMANAPPPPPSPRKQYHEHLQQGQLQEQEFPFGTSADRCKFHGEHDVGGSGRGGNDMVPFGDTLGCRESMSQSRAPQHDSKYPQRAHQDGGDAAASRLATSRWPTVDEVDGCDDRMLSVAAVMADNGEETTTRFNKSEGLQVSNDSDSGAQGRVAKAPEGPTGASAEPSETRSKRNELVESWLLDVRLETETAGTALRVLLRMCKERGRHDDEKRRLYSFRTALEGMGLFSPQHGPMPTSFEGDDGHLIALRVKAAARQVAMTKAAVKNMLRLLESAEPGEVGDAEIDQYADFILQQGEIMIGGGDHQNADNGSPRAEGVASTPGVANQGDENKTLLADMAVRHRSAATSDNDALVVVPQSYFTPIDAAETPADVNGASTAHRTPTLPLGGADGFEAGVTGTNDASKQEQQTNMPSTQGVSRQLHVTDASALNTASVDDGTSSSAICSPNAAVAAVDPPVVPTKGTEVALAIDANKSKTDPPVETTGRGTVDSCRTPMATSSADAERSPRKFVDPERATGKLKEGEHRNDSLDQGEGSARPTLLPASLSSGPLRNITDAATTVVPARATVGVAVAADVAPAGGASVGQGVVDEIAIPSSPASPAAANTSTALSARERLLRHVRAATSPRSDATSCSSGSDDDEGGVHQPATGAKQLEQGTERAQEKASGAGYTPEGANGVGVNHNPITIDDTKTERAGNRADDRPLTTHPVKRVKAGRDDGGGREKGGEEAATSIDASGENGTSIAQLRDLSAPVEMKNGNAVELEEVTSPVAPTSHDTAQGDEPKIEVTPIPEAAGKDSNDTAATEMSGGTNNSGVDPVQPGDNLVQEKNGSITSGPMARAAGDDGIAHDAKSKGTDDHPEASARDIATQAEKKGSKDIHDVAASASTSARPDVIERVNEYKGEHSTQAAAVAVAAENESTKTESDQTTAENRDGNPVANAGKTAQPAEETEENVDTKPEPGGEVDVETRAIADDDEIAGAGAAATEPDWIEGYDPGHDCYYYHHVPTGESRWYKPDEPYEPYVHSDEDQEGDDAPLSSVEDNSQTATAGPRDEKDYQRRERSKEREHDGHVGSKNYRRGHTGSREDAEEATSTRSSSAHKSKKSSRKRTSKSGEALTSGLRGRNRYDDGERYVSRSSSGDGRRGDGRRRRMERSSRQREKTALERLNDLTDENSCASDDLRSVDGGGRSHRRGSSSRRGSKESRRNSNSEHRRDSYRKRSSGERAKTSQSSATHEKRYNNESIGTRSRSAKSSRSIVYSDGRSSGNDDDYERGTPCKTRSGRSSRGDSESRRNSR